MQAYTVYNVAEMIMANSVGHDHLGDIVYTLMTRLSSSTQHLKPSRAWTVLRRQLPNSASGFRGQKQNCKISVPVSH